MEFNFTTYEPKKRTRAKQFESLAESQDDWAHRI